MTTGRDYVVWSYEHRGWWRPGRWGYTPHLHEAGRYTRAEATGIVLHANVVEVNEELLTLADARAEEAAHGPRSATVCVTSIRR